jgi:hypothetical protein
MTYSYRRTMLANDKKASEKKPNDRKASRKKPGRQDKKQDV